MMEGGGLRMEDRGLRMEDRAIHAVPIHRFPVSSVLRFIGTSVHPASVPTSTADGEARHHLAPPQSYGVGMTNTLSATGSPRSCS
jgi:hypothetical protein